jgi:succinate-semialdehyde dehydrogenase/glutarate-semialdehyde dehydrogenase
MAIQTVNPATGERVRDFVPLTPRDVEAKLARADEARRHWRRVPVAERARIVRRAGEILVQTTAAS